MIQYIFTILISFLFTFLICIPFISLLYKLNIRRVAKIDLQNALPGRSVKMGTPIMGGFVILASILVFSSIVLRDWEFYPLIVVVVLVGGLFGAIDEYVNTLGRTIMAIRISKSKNKNHMASVIPAKGWLLIVKKVLLIPWKIFEEVLRVSGSTQGGLKSHYKFLMHFVLASYIAYYLYSVWGSTTLFIPVIHLDLNLGIFYYIFLVFLLLFFDTAFGITDGMDGLSAGTHSIVFVVLGILAAYYSYTEVAYLSFIIVGSVLAFLYFNIYPARFEMSDNGTLVLGMLFVLIGAFLSIEVSLFIIGALFVVEILSSLIQQWSVKLRGKRVFLVAPIHHHFEKLGWHETRVVMRFWLFTVITALFGVFISLL